VDVKEDQIMDNEDEEEAPVQTKKRFNPFAKGNQNDLDEQLKQQELAKKKEQEEED
jgi:hypothetical protein